MRLPVSALAFLLICGHALAQSPQSVPLRNNTPSRETTVDRPPSTGDDRTAAEVPNARNRSNGQVAPPSTIDTPVQIIAPERKP